MNIFEIFLNDFSGEDGILRDLWYGRRYRKGLKGTGMYKKGYEGSEIYFEGLLMDILSVFLKD